MANARDDRTAVDRLIADFSERVEGLRRDGVPSYPPLGGRTPWAEAPETRKLEEIVEHSTHVWLGAGWFTPDADVGDEVIAVPGTAALEMVERHVDYAGLPSVQGQMLRDLRAGLDAGQVAGPPPDGKDLVAMGLARVVGIGDFDERLAALKQDEDRPWAEVPEDIKFRVIVELAQEAGPPGAYALEAIFREVDRSKVSAWRREALDGLCDRLDRGELEGENPNPLYQGDHAQLALRLAELESRIEDFKQLGVQDASGTRRPWRELGEERKRYEIAFEMEELYLTSEPAARVILGRNVDLSRVPDGREVPSSGEIGDGPDAMPTPEERRKLNAELTHDYGLRRMEDREVRYEDEPARAGDAEPIRDRTPEANALPSPGEIADLGPDSPGPGRGPQTRRGR